MSFFCAYSLGSVYLLEPKRKVVITFVIGLFFSAYSWIIFFLSPIIGKYLLKLQPMLVLFLESILEGTTQVLFGFVTSLKAQWTFFLRSFLFQITSAVCVLFLQTSIIAVFVYYILIQKRF